MYYKGHGQILIASTQACLATLSSLFRAGRINRGMGAIGPPPGLPNPSFTHLSNQSERCWLQYTFINPFESDNTNFTKSIFIMILRSDVGLFEKIDFEIEAFALEKQWWNPADWQWTESWETRLKERFRDK